LFNPSVIITHIKTKEEVNLGSSIFARALAKLISLFLSGSYEVKKPADLGSLQKEGAVIDLQDSVHLLQNELEKKIPLGQKNPLTSQQLQETSHYLGLLHTHKNNLFDAADKMQELQQRLFTTGQHPPKNLRNELTSLHQKLEGRLTKRVKEVNVLMTDIRKQGLNQGNASAYLSLVTELMSYRAICPPDSPLQDSIAKILPHEAAAFALLTKADPTIQQGLQHQLSETAKWVDNLKQSFPTLNGLEAFSNEIEKQLSQIASKPSPVTPPLKTTEVEATPIDRLKKLQQALTTYRGLDALGEARKLAPGLESQIKDTPQLRDAYRVMINQANARSFLSQPSVMEVSDVEVMMLKTMGITVDEPMKKEFRRLVQEDIANYSKPSKNMPEEIMIELSETPSSEMHQKIRKRLTQRLLEATKRPISEEKREKLVAALLQVSQQSGQALLSIGNHPLLQQSNIPSEALMRHLLTSFLETNGAELKKMILDPSTTQKEIDAFVTEKFTAIQKEYLETLQEVVQTQQFSSLAKSWMKENEKYCAWSSSQNVDEHRVLGEGICFANGIAVNAYVASHPSESPEQVQEHLAMRRGGKETTATTEVQHFTAADRFFQAIYQMELEKDAFDAASAPPAILKAYKVEEKQIRIPNPEKDPLLAKQDPTSLALNFINSTIDSNAFRGSHGTFVLLTEEKEGQGAHAIVLRVDPEQKRYSLYDPNYGWYEFPDRKTFDQQLSSYFKTIQSDMTPVQLNAYIPTKA
jgi:hypothetical protein